MTGLQTADGGTLLDAPGSVCPEQFRDVWGRSNRSSGEMRLAMAVLVQAIGDLLAFRDGVAGSEAQRLYGHARRWIASDDRQWPYSFINVSEILNLPSVRMRFRLLDRERSRSRSGVQYAGGRFRRHRLTKKSVQPADTTSGRSRGSRASAAEGGRRNASPRA